MKSDKVLKAGTLKAPGYFTVVKTHKNEGALSVFTAEYHVKFGAVTRYYLLFFAAAAKKIIIFHQILFFQKNVFFML